MFTEHLIVTQAHIAAHIIQVPDLRFELTMDVKPQHICDFLAFPAFKLSRTRRVSMTRRQKRKNALPVVRILVKVVHDEKGGAA